MTAKMIEMPHSTIHQIVTHAGHELPYECCGLLVDVGGKMFARPCRNDSQDQDSFDMCASDLLRWHESGETIIGTYHSHPRGLPYPSEGDEALLEKDQLHLIVGMNGSYSIGLYRFFALDGFEEVDYQVVK